MEKKLNEEQIKIVSASEDRIVVNASAGSGKAQPDYTIIPTPDGYKTLDELTIGDYVFDRYGKPTKVLGIFPQGEKEIFEVELCDHTVIECCEDHLWSYYYKRGKTLKTASLKEIKNMNWKEKDCRGHNVFNITIPRLVNSVTFNKNINLDIPPYVMGCFLGDGCCTEPYLTISSNDEELVKTIGEMLNFTYKKRSTRNYSWDFYNNGKKIRTDLFFKEYTQELCCLCGNKKIPEDYLFGTEEQRLELLQGLMDTDGNCGDGRHSAQFCTTSKQLAEDVLNLSRSLGFYSNVKVFNRTNKKSIEYTVYIYTPNEKTYQLFRLSRKKEKALTWINKEKRLKHKVNTIRDIRSTGRKASMRCILVDNKEHLYLTNNYVVTHNTLCAVNRLLEILQRGIEPTKIVFITFTNAAAAEMRERAGDAAKDVFIGTIHSYANRLLVSRGINTSHLINDEDFDGLFELIKKNPWCIREVDYLILDEGQDSTASQFNFLLDIVKPKQWMIFSDHRQSIYGFNGAYPDYIINLMNRDDVTTYYLRNNYRTGERILSFAKAMIDNLGFSYTDHSLSMRERPGKVLKTRLSPEKISNYILNTEGNFKDWFVLTRTNAELDEIFNYLQKKGIPCETFKKKDLTANDLQEKMNNDTVKVLTVHTAKGLEAKRVIVFGVNAYNAEETRVAYVAATRAKDLLIWSTGRERGQRKRVKAIDDFLSNWE